MPARPRKTVKLQPLRRRTLVESIIQQLVELIHDGHLLPGDRLPSEHQLMAMLGVSRSSVREALHALAAMDLVEMRVGAGTFVKQLSQPFETPGSDFEALSDSLQRKMRLEYDQARLVLEEGTVTLAAENITETSRRRILDALRAYEESVAAGRVFTEWETDHQIHLRIAEAAGNAFLLRMLRNLLNAVPQTLLDRIMSERPRSEQEAIMEAQRAIHGGLAQAVARGDRDAAQMWIRRHATYGRQLVEEYFQAQAQHDAAGEALAPAQADR